MRIVILQSNLLGRFAPVVTANLLLNIALNLLVIPRYSYVGAAWVSLNSSIIDLFIRVHFVRKVLGQKIDYWSMLPKPFAALGGMITCLLVLHSVWLPLRVLVSVIPYFYLLKWLGVYDREEIDKFIREPVARFLAHIRGRK
jgi:O-antigen/teichoic acid export membrane protein